MNKAIVLHADILGFRNIIRGAENETDDTTLNKLRAALEQGIGTVTQFQQLGINAPIQYKLFSDNLYVSFTYNEGDDQSLSDAYLSCLAFVRSYTAVMMDHKIFIRGGISIGNDFSDESIIFSMALVKAYELESKAIYPRILIDDELIAFAKSGKMITPGPVFLNVLNNSILQDENGLYFINPTGLSEELNVEAAGFKGAALNQAFIKRDLVAIKEIIAAIPPDDPEIVKITTKYEWLQKVLIWLYHNRDNQQSKVNIFKSLRFTKQ